MALEQGLHPLDDSFRINSAANNRVVSTAKKGIKTAPVRSQGPTNAALPYQKVPESGPQSRLAQLRPTTIC